MGFEVKFEESEVIERNFDVFSRKFERSLNGQICHLLVSV